MSSTWIELGLDSMEFTLISNQFEAKWHGAHSLPYKYNLLWNCILKKRPINMVIIKKKFFNISVYSLQKVK